MLIVYVLKIIIVIYGFQYPIVGIFVPFDRLVEGFLVFGFWFWVLGFWFLVFGFWVSGFRFLVSGFGFRFWFQVLGFGFLVFGFPSKGSGYSIENKNTGRTSVFAIELFKSINFFEENSYAIIMKLVIDQSTLHNRFIYSCIGLLC